MERYCAGTGLGSEAGAGPTLGAGGLGQSTGAKASGPSAAQSSFYHNIEPSSHAPPASGVAATQAARGTATGAGFDSTYSSTAPVSRLLIRLCRPEH